MDTIVHTPRLLLKRLSLEDANGMHAYASDEETTRYLTWSRHRNIQDTINAITFISGLNQKGENDGFAIHLPDTGMIGTIGMKWKASDRGEIGYCLAKPYWGKGLITEAATAFLEYLWEKHEGLQTIEARCNEEHIASAKVMQKLGMEYVGYLPNEVFVNIDPEKEFPVLHYQIHRAP